MKRSEMKKQGAFRDYNFSDAELYLWSQEVLSLVQKDSKYFSEQGFDEKHANAMLRLAERFRECPSDDELIGDQMIMTEKKDDAAHELRNAIRAIMNRVGMVFNNRGGRYRKFGTAKIGDMTDPQLLFCGRRVVRVARLQFDFLEESGLNEGHIRRAEEMCTAFERALNIQQDKIHDRDIGVENRVELGNKLYKIFVIVCHIGKDIWGREEWARYEKFVIYESNNEQKKKRKAAEGQ
jgi:hypothetical protein